MKKFAAAVGLMFKRYTSVAMAAVRPIVWKLLLIVLAMTAVETGLFLLRWEGCNHTNCFIDNIWVFPRIVYSLALAALMGVIMRQGGWLAGGKSGYTVHRLPVSELAVVLIWAGVYFTAYLILHAVQIGIILGLWELFADGKHVALAISFYSNRFLHGLFPMENLYRHVYNVIWPVSMALSLSFSAYSRRRGTEQMAPYGILAVQLLFMGGYYDVYGLEIMKMVSVVLLTVISVANAWRCGHGEN